MEALRFLKWFIKKAGEITVWVIVPTLLFSALFHILKPSKLVLFLVWFAVVIILVVVGIKSIWKAYRAENPKHDYDTAVSYTHLTLPTNREV